jgi:hypothetical protein
MTTVYLECVNAEQYNLHSLSKIKLIFWCITGTGVNLKGNNDNSATRHIPFGAGVLKLHCYLLLALLRGDYGTIFSSVHIEGSRVT